jgi:hypothetical protein
MKIEHRYDIGDKVYFIYFSLYKEPIQSCLAEITDITSENSYKIDYEFHVPEKHIRKTIKEIRELYFSLHKKFETETKNYDLKGW